MVPLVCGSLLPKARNTQTTLVHSGEGKACRKEVGEEKSNYPEREVGREEGHCLTQHGDAANSRQSGKAAFEPGRSTGGVDHHGVVGAKGLCGSGRAQASQSAQSSQDKQKPRLKKSLRCVHVCISLPDFETRLIT